MVGWTLVCNSDFSAARNRRARTPKLQASRRPQAYQWWAAMEWCSWAASRSARPPPRSCCASLSSHSLWRSSSSSPCSSSYSFPFDRMQTGAVSGLSRRAARLFDSQKEKKKKKKRKMRKKELKKENFAASIVIGRTRHHLCGPHTARRLFVLVFLSCPPPDLRFDNLIKLLLF